MFPCWAFIKSNYFMFHYLKLWPLIEWPLLLIRLFFVQRHGLFFAWILFYEIMNIVSSPPFCGGDKDFWKNFPLPGGGSKWKFLLLFFLTWECIFQSSEHHKFEIFSQSCWNMQLHEKSKQNKQSKSQKGL